MVHQELNAERTKTINLNFPQDLICGKQPVQFRATYVVVNSIFRRGWRMIIIADQWPGQWSYSDRGRFVNNLEISISILAPTINDCVSSGEGILRPIPSSSVCGQSVGLACVIGDSREQQQSVCDHTHTGRSIILNDQLNFIDQFVPAAAFHHHYPGCGAQVPSEDRPRLLLRLPTKWSTLINYSPKLMNNWRIVSKTLLFWFICQNFGQPFYFFLFWRTWGRAALLEHNIWSVPPSPLLCVEKLKRLIWRMKKNYIQPWWMAKEQKGINWKVFPLLGRSSSRGLISGVLISSGSDWPS